MLGAGALGRPRGMVWGGRREEGSGWGTHIYLWQIHFDIWQNQYNIVKLNKIKLTNKQTTTTTTTKKPQNTNPIISRQDYHLTQPCPSEEKQQQQKTQHKSHPIGSLHKPIDQP